MSAGRAIYVYADWLPEGPVPVGVLLAAGNRGRESLSFSYSEAWLRRGDATALDPGLHPHEGPRRAPSDKSLFGAFSDSRPDRWGRLLMRRGEAVAARHEGRKPRALLESDYLIGVRDETRMGGLRYSLEEGGVFQSSDRSLAAPPWTELRALEAAAIAFEDEDDPEEEKWLRRLLAPGSSLGGARPKASVTAPDGSLWIAKFPSRRDEWDVGAWKITTHDLARLCGLNVPEARMGRLSRNGGTFLARRFDRDGARRVHFESAMALLGRTDGAEDASYLDIASFIRSRGAAPERDLRELWARIVFNIAVSNTDDHLRNHGFLLTESGWRLAPAYDVNPDIHGGGLSLNISREDNSLALETAGFYGVSPSEAERIVSGTKEAVEGNWRPIAESHGLSREAMRRMASAFDMRRKGRIAP